MTLALLFGMINHQQQNRKILMSYFSDTWRLAQCCQFYDPRLVKLYNPGTTTKKTSLTLDGKSKVQQKAILNAKKLLRVLSEYFAKQPIHLRAWRISSELFPCYTLEHCEPWYQEIEEELSEIMFQCGEVARRNDIRLSTHPAQYTVLGSPRSDVVSNSIKDLHYHALFGKMMGLEPEDFVINIHLQGLYGGKHSDGINRFSTNFQYLDDYTQRALAVENEDKQKNGYDIKHVLELCQRIPTRATLDIHHYMCHRMTETVKVDGKNQKVRDVRPITHVDTLFKESVKTWKTVRPLFHVSQSFPLDNPDYWMKPQAHAPVLWDEELLSIWVPMLQYADFDIEAKNKEQATKQAYRFVLEEETYAGEPL